MKKIIAMGLLWFCVFAFLFQVLTGFFLKPKRAAGVNNSENPFIKNDGSSNNNGKISDPPIPVDPNLPILTGKLDHVLVEVQRCIGNGAELSIEGIMTNQEADETLACSAGMYGSTKMYDDYGNEFKPNYIQVANLTTDYKMNINFIFGVPIKFIVRFKVPTVAGETQARTIKLFRLAIEGFQTDFRNIKVEKASKNLPTPTPVATPSPTPAITPTPNATPGATPTPVPTNTQKPNK